MTEPLCKNEKGSILLLTAFLAIVLLAVIGLLIDSAMLAASKTAHEQIADFAVLRAMEGYSSDGTADIPTRIGNAAAAAASAVSVNVESRSWTQVWRRR